MATEVHKSLGSWTRVTSTSGGVDGSLASVANESRSASMLKPRNVSAGNHEFPTQHRTLGIREPDERRECELSSQCVATRAAAHYYVGTLGRRGPDQQLDFIVVHGRQPLHSLATTRARSSSKGTPKGSPL